MSYTKADYDSDDHSGSDQDAYTNGETAYDEDEEWDRAMSATRILTKQEQSHAERSLSEDCPWCVSITIAQIARSTNWNCHYTMSFIRQLVRLVVAITIQYMILRFFGYSLATMRPFGGQPRLCNMGKNFFNCDKYPNGLNCIGPGGTVYSGNDLYSNFGIWSTRVYFKQSLEAIFKGNATMLDKIEQKIDPGEYGLEDVLCRYLAILLLGIQLADELRQILQMIVLVHWLPCDDTPWVTLEDPVDSEGRPIEVTKEWEKSDEAADSVKFRYGGMPCCWKLYSYLIIFIRAAICFIVGNFGTSYLLDTAAIEDLILNSLALTFVLSLDDLIQSAWSSGDVKKTVALIEPYKTHRNHPVTICLDCIHKWIPVPVEAIITAIGMGSFIAYNFFTHCDITIQGGWASKAIYGVMYGHYTIFKFLQKTTYPTAQWCPPTGLVANVSCQKMPGFVDMP